MATKTSEAAHSHPKTSAHSGNADDKSTTCDGKCHHAEAAVAAETVLSRRRRCMFKWVIEGGKKVLYLADGSKEQGFDDGDRLSPGSKINWIKVDPRHLIILHTSRRQPHFIVILAEEDGVLEIDDYFEIKLSMLSETMVVESSSRKNHRPYDVLVKCPKDPGASCECKKMISAQKVSESLSLAISTLDDGPVKERLTTILERFESCVMEKLLEHDKKRIEQERANGFMRPYAYFGRCPKDGCVCNGGFFCNPRDRMSARGPLKIIRCPTGCTDEHGVPTWWCSICGGQHLEDENCPLPDPRKDMSTEQLAFFDSEVKAGRMQWCPECFACHSKDLNCDHVTCPRCRTEYCHGCGERFTGDYINHIIMGPVDEMHPRGHYGCRRTLIRWSAENRTGHRDWLTDSVMCSPLMQEVRVVLEDPMRPLEDEGRLFLQEIIARAIDRGSLR